VRTTDSRHALPIAPNVLARDFTAAAPNRVWLADITYIPTDERLAVSRRDHGPLQPQDRRLGNARSSAY
jgi:transposase InsO family protein